VSETVNSSTDIEMEPVVVQGTKPEEVTRAYGLSLNLRDPIPQQFTTAELHARFPNADVAEVIIYHNGGETRYTWQECYERLGITPPVQEVTEPPAVPPVPATDAP